MQYTEETKRSIRREIKLFIEYGVRHGEQELAFKTVDYYKENSIALHVLKDFYGRLPELREEAVNNISKIVSRNGVYLIGVDTKNFQYLYFHDGEEPYYLGEKKDGIGDGEVLRFFGYGNNDEFLKTVDDRSHDYADLRGQPDVFCPACGVEEGQKHYLGCPVEVCPWCDGQLSNCNCRFEKLGVEEIADESEIDRLEVVLDEKGRIPFTADHAPSYPSGGDGE